MALTRRQKEALDFIDEFIRDNGYSPSFGEIAAGLGLASIATVHKHLTALESKGYLVRSFNQSRALDLGPRYYEERKARREDQAAAEPPPAPEVPLRHPGALTRSPLRGSARRSPTRRGRPPSL